MQILIIIKKETDAKQNDLHSKSILDLDSWSLLLNLLSVIFLQSLETYYIHKPLCSSLMHIIQQHLHFHPQRNIKACKLFLLNGPKQVLSTLSFLQHAQADFILLALLQPDQKITTEERVPNTSQSPVSSTPAGQNTSVLLAL